MLDPEITNNWLDFDDFQKKYQKVPVKEYPNNLLGAVPNPAVSVRITTYQHAQYIRDTLNAVLMQKTEFPFEIIIGDDDSSDGTREICIEYAQKYPKKIRLFLHNRENNIQVLDKPCGIFQIGYNSFKCRGKFIAGCSGDDYWTDPCKLQKQYDFLSNNSDFSFCYTPWYEHVLDVNNNVISTKIRDDFAKAVTMMFVNVFDRIPNEFFNVLSEDDFTKAILSKVGKNKLLENINPTVYRIHSKNIYAGSDSEFRVLNLINTQIYLLKTFKKSEGAFYRLNKISKIISYRLINQGIDTENIFEKLKKELSLSSYLFIVTLSYIYGKYLYLKLFLKNYRDVN